MKKQVMRDAFWDAIYELAKEDKDIIVVSADFGAPSLDKFREDFPDQYINVGIAEQNAILVATGLALAGKKPIAYAITQFITLRCYEQIRIYPCGMNLPVTIVGVGAGACYWESGATHHCFEQLPMMRILPHLKTYNCSDQEMASHLAEYAVDRKGPKFIQLDRDFICDLHERDYDFEDGFSWVTDEADLVILATGNMVKEALEIKNRINNQDHKIGIIDLFRFPVKEEKLCEAVRNVKHLVTIEESSLAGGMGSYILEIFNRHKVKASVRCYGMDLSEGYEGSYNYGGRDTIRKEYQLDLQSIERYLETYSGRGSIC